MASAKDEAVRRMVLHYTQNHYEEHPLIASLHDDNHSKQTLERLLLDEEMTIGSRSLDLDSHEINHFQKAFYMLRDLENQNPATALWVEEILGASLVDAERRDRYVRKKMMVKARVNDALSTEDVDTKESTSASSAEDSESSSGSSESETTSSSSEVSSSRHTPSPSPHEREDTAAKCSFALNGYNNDPNLLRIFETYNEGAFEFNATADKSLDRTTAAKFLRDTIENLLGYVYSKAATAGIQAEDILEGKLLKEITLNLQKMKAIVEKGCGGRKRPFEGGYSAEGTSRKQRSPAAPQHVEQSNKHPRSAIEHEPSRRRNPSINYHGQRSGVPQNLSHQSGTNHSMRHRSANSVSCNHKHDRTPKTFRDCRVPSRTPLSPVQDDKMRVAHRNAKDRKSSSSLRDRYRPSY